MSNTEKKTTKDIAAEIIHAVVNNYHYDTVLDVLYDDYQLTDEEYEEVLQLCKNGIITIA